MKPLNREAWVLLHKVYDADHTLHSLICEVCETLFDYHGWALHGQDNPDTQLRLHQQVDIRVELECDVKLLLRAMGRPVNEAISIVSYQDLIDYAVGLLINNFLPVEDNYE